MWQYSFSLGCPHSELSYCSALLCCLWLGLLSCSSMLCWHSPRLIGHCFSHARWSEDCASAPDSSQVSSYRHWKSWSCLMSMNQFASQMGQAYSVGLRKPHFGCLSRTCCPIYATYSRWSSVRSLDFLIHQPCSSVQFLQISWVEHFAWLSVSFVSVSSPCPWSQTQYYSQCCVLTSDFRVRPMHTG